jgi:hypothetical protein
MRPLLRSELSGPGKEKGNARLSPNKASEASMGISSRNVKPDNVINYVTFCTYSGVQVQL